MMSWTPRGRRWRMRRWRRGLTARLSLRRMRRLSGRAARVAVLVVRVGVLVVLAAGVLMRARRD